MKENQKMTQKLNSNTWKNIDRNNKYFEFIEECKNKKYIENTILHLHHIIPQYVIGKNPSLDDKLFIQSSQNIIILSVEDHAKAHKLLYEIYGNEQDNGATLMLNNYETESRKIWRTLGAKEVNKLMRDQKRTFWDPEFQKEMATRSMAKDNAIEIRKIAGKKGGLATKKGIAINSQEKYIFNFEDQPVLCIINCNSGQEVLNELNKFKYTPLQRVTPLLKGERKKLHGWSCKKLNADGSIS